MDWEEFGRIKYGDSPRVSRLQIVDSQLHKLGNAGAVPIFN
jgi:hypothetical protein